MKKVILIFLMLYYKEIQCNERAKHVDVPIFKIRPCNGSQDILVSYEQNTSPIEEKHYMVHIKKSVTKNTKIILTLDSEGSISLRDKNYARISAKDKKTFEIRVFKLHDNIAFTVKGQSPRTVPYIRSIVIDTKEICSQPLSGYLDNLTLVNKDYVGRSNKHDNENCGRRKVAHAKLNANYVSTKPGDWPWHTAIYKHDNTEIKYICGGTLISKSFVLTAAQCTSEKGVPVLPETLSVFLGKFNLIGGDAGSKESQVDKTIVHKNFNYRNLDNDVSLLKLKTEVVFSDFVQPACLWNGDDKLPSDEVIGTIVGWNFDTTDWSPHLQQAKMPMVSESTCLNSNPIVYSNILNSNKFCAGYGVRGGKARSALQAVSNCNGDSGSAFQIFVPDKNNDKSTEVSGAWYVRGTVSLTVSRHDSPTCDPQQYVVFTDIEKYTDWINQHLEEK